LSRIDLQNLPSKLFDTKRLADIAGNAGALRFDDFLYRRIGTHHDERQIRVIFVSPYPLKASARR
jgi:hypothetical protein